MTKNQKSLYLDGICQLFYLYLPDASIDVTNFIACQFALESNFGNSRLAIHYNNHCGMKAPFTRPTTNYESDSFAHFKDVESCVIDYCYWLCYNRVTQYQLQNLDLFISRLDELGYCPDDDYISKIEDIYIQFCV